MTHEDIIRMARDAADPDAVDPLCGSDWGDLITLDLDEMVRFAALVAAHEREACERLAWDTPDDEETGIRSAIALAIRARGEK